MLGTAAESMRTKTKRIIPAVASYRRRSTLDGRVDLTGLLRQPNPAPAEKSSSVERLGYITALNLWPRNETTPSTSSELCDGDVGMVAPHATQQPRHKVGHRDDDARRDYFIWRSLDSSCRLISTHPCRLASEGGRRRAVPDVAQTMGQSWILNILRFSLEFDNTHIVRLLDRVQVVLAADRLCYAASPDPEEEARYIPLDRVPVRAMPRGYAPDIGVSPYQDRHLPATHVSIETGCAFSVACGSSVHIFAASSPQEAEVGACLPLRG